MVRFQRPGPLDLQQQAHARTSLNLAFSGIPVANTRHGRGVDYETADLRSPQVFVAHPFVFSMIDPSTVGVDTALPSLPGRPPSGWDGEPGAGSPIGTY